SRSAAAFAVPPAAAARPARPAARRTPARCSGSQRAYRGPKTGPPTAIQLVSHSSGYPAAKPGMTHRNERNVH
ncbi:MAG: hypothetical protein ACRDRJ_40095, partial [Streptosporangiaceae bacterium]